MIRAVIFDCFGVLVEDVLAAMLKKLAPEKMEEAVQLMHAAHHGFVTSVDSNREIAALLGMDMEQYRAAIREGEIKNQALLNYVAELHRHYKTGMLSNVSGGGIARRFSPEELKRFDVVVASGEVGYAKPEAAIYEITAERLGVRLDECVFTDDREEYCEAAQAVGMRAIVYQNFRQFKTELESLLSRSEA